jgi:hypothetical protein
MSVAKSVFKTPWHPMAAWRKLPGVRSTVIQMLSAASGRTIRRMKWLGVAILILTAWRGKFWTDDEAVLKSIEA